MRTSVAGSPTIKPAFRRPMNVSSSPMPAAAAARSDAGMASAIRSRGGVADTTRNSTPAQNTMPSAVCHGTLLCNTIVNAKNALRPMPGATANGRRAYRPMSSVMLAATSTVAVSAPVNGIPVPGVDRMPGLTTTMYAIVKNVVTPPITSAYGLRSRGASVSVMRFSRMVPSPISFRRGLSSTARVTRDTLVTVFGRWRWEAPAWLRVAGAQGARGWRHLAAKPARAALVALAIVGAGGAAYWYATRPKPHYVRFTVAPPGLTEYDENGISSIKPVKVLFNESAAPLRQLQKAVTAGIDLSPAIAGTWFWTSDKELQFTPKDDWPVDGAFSVQLAKKGLLASRVELETYGFTFRSQPFIARISESQFYQDPRDPNLKKLVATVQFTHPVDPDRLQPRVSLLVAKDAEYLGLGPDSRHFTIAYDKFKLAAYVHSAALAMPRDDTPMTLRIDKGVRAARGGNDSRDRIEAVVTIPGRRSLRFSDARMTVVDNARYEPEQILLLASSSPVVERAFAGNISLHVL